MTTTFPYAVEPLGAAHNRDMFSCGVEALDLYIRQRAGQERRRHVANCFVAIHKKTGELAGYYTLSATAVIFDALPEPLRKKLPRYPEVPAALLGRLAVDTKHQGKKLGEFLLFDAMYRTLYADLAAAVLVVDAKNDRAARFYKQHGFLSLSQIGKRLYIPVSHIGAIFP